MTKHFGEHLTIDGYDGNKELLNDRDFILKFIRELPEILGMKILAEPQIVLAPDNGLKDPGGWSSFVIIAESHISIHTFPARGFLTADVYTCKNGMDTEFIKKHFTEKFNLKDLETNFIIRGMKYPKDNIY